MGYYFGANRAAWTFFVIVYTSVNAASGDHTLITDLGLDILPDKAKVPFVINGYSKQKIKKYCPTCVLHLLSFNIK